MIIQEIEYSGQYNDKFRPITNEPIITVELSPTGSGKSTFYKDSPNTLMLMPTNTLVRQNKGLISKTRAKEGERTEWAQINTTKCDYMTYNKFLGHLNAGVDISNMNIIIDEAHLLLINDNPLYSDLARILFARERQYNELKLITATIRDEVLDLYSQFIEAKTDNEISVCKYLKSDAEPLIVYCLDKIPEIDPTKRTLFFINSKMKILQMKRHLEEKYQGIRICILSSDEENLPTEEKFKNHDVIFSTSIIKQGYSIQTHIDTLIIHNVYNPIGAVDMLQYLARPRNNQPNIVLISSKTAFSVKWTPRDIPSLQKPNIKYLLERTQEYAKNGYISNSDIQQLNEAFGGNKLAKCIVGKTPKFSLVAHYFEDAMRWHENKISVYEHGEYVEYAYSLKKSMEALSSRKVKFHRVNSEDKPYDTEDIVFSRVNFNDVKTANYESLSELKEELLSIIDDEEEDEARKIKAKQYLDIKPVTEEFSLEDKTYKFTEKTLVRQMLEPNVLIRCQQHMANIDNKIYQLRDDAVRTNRRIAIGLEMNTIKAKQRLSFITRLVSRYNIPMRFPLSSDRDILETLQKLYSFERYSDKEMTKRLSDSRIAGVAMARITSIFPVEDNWFEEVE